MNKEILENVKKKIDDTLKAKGIDPTISDFNKKLKEELEKQAMDKIAEAISAKVVEVVDGIVEDKIKGIQTDQEQFKQEVIDAIKGIEINNQVEVNSPDVNIPEIIIPEIKVPEPKVKIDIPKIDVPKVEMPKEMEVKGFMSFVKAVFEILKNQITVRLGGIDRDRPLPVILVDEKGRYYKALQSLVSSGGGGNIKGLMNVAGDIINPSTEDKQDTIITNLGTIQGKQDEIISDTDELIAGLITNDSFNGYGLYGVEDDGTNTYVASQNADGK